MCCYKKVCRDLIDYSVPIRLFLAYEEDEYQKEKGNEKRFSNGNTIFLSRFARFMSKLIRENIIIFQ